MTELALQRSPASAERLRRRQQAQPVGKQQRSSASSSPPPAPLLPYLTSPGAPAARAPVSDLPAPASSGPSAFLTGVDVEEDEEERGGAAEDAVEEKQQQHHNAARSSPPPLGRDPSPPYTIVQHGVPRSPPARVVAHSRSALSSSTSKLPLGKTVAALPATTSLETKGVADKRAESQANMRMRLALAQQGAMYAHAHAQALARSGAGAGAAERPRRPERTPLPLSLPGGASSQSLSRAHSTPSLLATLSSSSAASITGVSSGAGAGGVVAGSKYISAPTPGWKTMLAPLHVAKQLLGEAAGSQGQQLPK